MNLILASSNAHKAEEFNTLFKASEIEILPASKSIEVVEDGSSFEENALKKSSAYAQELGAATMADDSGLVIPDYPEILGIHSARYRPDLKTYEEKCRNLIDLAAGSSAYFICVLSFYLSEKEHFFFEGRIHGKIAHHYLPGEGFGYDPIFIPDGQDGRSLAELSDFKHKFGHRAKAVQQSIKFFAGKNALPNRS